jgi:hypothetical protein
VKAAHHKGFNHIRSMSESLRFARLKSYLFGKVFIELLLDCFNGLDDWQFGLRLCLQNIVEPFFLIPRYINSVDSAETFCWDYIRFISEGSPLLDGEAKLFGEGLPGKLESGLVDYENNFIPELVCDLVVQIRNGTKVRADILQQLRVGERWIIRQIYLWSQYHFYGHAILL